MICFGVLLMWSSPRRMWVIPRWVSSTTQEKLEGDDPPALEEGLLVPVETEPFEILEDLLEEPRLRPLQVGVLDAEQEFPPGVAGGGAGEDCRPGGPHAGGGPRAAGG